MARYILFGGRNKNGQEAEGGWHDMLASTDSIEEIESQIRVEQETSGVAELNESTGQFERIGTITRERRYIDIPRRDLIGNPILWTKHLDWGHIVDIETMEIVREYSVEED